MGSKNYLKNTEYEVNRNAVIRFLDSMTNAINIANNEINKININLPTDEFKHFVEEYRAIKVISEKFKILQGARRLFVKGIAEMHDPIFQDSRPFSIIIQKPNRNQGGGSKKYKYIGGESSIPLPDDYALSYVCNINEEVTHAFLLNVQTCMPYGFLAIHQGDNTIYITPYDILCLLYNGFVYIGETPLNPNIIQILIDHFVLDTEGYGLDEFKTFYDSIQVPLNPATIFPYSALGPELATTNAQFTQIKLAESESVTTRAPGGNENIPVFRSKKINTKKNYNNSRKGKLAKTNVYIGRKNNYKYNTYKIKHNYNSSLTV